MSDCYTEVEVNGKTIQLESEWAGEKEAPFSRAGSHGPAQHNTFTVTTDDGEAEFDFWGSQMHPRLDDEYSLCNAFHCVCDDALYYLWDQLDEVVGDMTYSEAKRVEEGCHDSADKLASIGITEDDMEYVVNNEDWQ